MTLTFFIFNWQAVGVAFEVHDSYMRSKAIAKSDTIDVAKLEKLKLESEFYSINTKLSFSKLFAYCYCYIGILTGPYFKFRTYNDWINFKYVNSIDHTRLMFKRGNTLPFIAIGYLALSQIVSFKVNKN
jgi:lysophospholipid acyltransferase 7